MNCNCESSTDYCPSCGKSNELLKLVEDRKTIIELQDKNWNEETDDWIDQDAENEYDNQLDINSDIILKCIRENIDMLSIESMILALTHCGWNVNLLYDDNGHFSFGYPIYSQIPLDGPMNMNMNIHIEKKEWFENMREALQYFLNSELNVQNL